MRSQNRSYSIQNLATTLALSAQASGSDTDEDQSGTPSPSGSDGPGYNNNGELTVDPPENEDIGQQMDTFDVDLLSPTHSGESSRAPNPSDHALHIPSPILPLNNTIPSSVPPGNSGASQQPATSSTAAETAMTNVNLSAEDFDDDAKPETQIHISWEDKPPVPAE
ncbi:hypothetical protein NP233_g9630 [Leucocoprinus birnbaumii]|uniref:Uncharacterized protein n=1 Tax=Leucocoprinus birnbaumii TaxID=56174 RepID=A0AAD5VKR2_9AGAR|nr:hypothetical protein NP233_g9630 [Leucocoprinus birnbaumii]